MESLMTTRRRWRGKSKSPRRWGINHEVYNQICNNHLLGIQFSMRPTHLVDGSDSVPNLPLPMKNIGKKDPGSFIHKLYGLRSPDPLHKRVGEPD